MDKHVDRIIQIRVDDDAFQGDDETNLQNMIIEFFTDRDVDVLMSFHKDVYYD